MDLLSRSQTSNAYNKIGMHLYFKSCITTSSEANPNFSHNAISPADIAQKIWVKLCTFCYKHHILHSDTFSCPEKI